MLLREVIYIIKYAQTFKYDFFLAQCFFMRAAKREKKIETFLKNEVELNNSNT